MAAFIAIQRSAHTCTRCIPSAHCTPPHARCHCTLSTHLVDGSRSGRRSVKTAAARGRDCTFLTRSDNSILIHEPNIRCNAIYSVLIRTLPTPAVMKIPRFEN